MMWSDIVELSQSVRAPTAALTNGISSGGGRPVRRGAAVRSSPVSWNPDFVDRWETTVPVARHRGVAAVIVTAALLPVTVLALPAQTETGAIIVEQDNADGQPIETDIHVELLSGGIIDDPIVAGSISARITNDTDRPITVAVKSGSTPPKRYRVNF